MNAEEIELTENEYADILTEMYGTLEICGITYDTGRALKQLDPVAFRCMKSDYESSLGYKCGECGQQFENEDHAEACCKEEEE